MFSLIWISLSLACAALVLADIVLLGRRQHMAIMNAVWPLTMLYAGPLGLAAYVWFGRGMTHGETPLWQAALKGATHCGAGCALGDMIGDIAVFATGTTLLGSYFAAELVFGFVLAYVLGVIFQYYAIAPMRGLGLRDGVIAAIKADTLSLLAYEVGMFAVMGLRAWALPALTPHDARYWFAMQIAMLAGLATAYPVNRWLITSGVKERM